MSAFILAASFVLTWLFGTLVTFSRKPDVPYFPDELGGRPTNILFGPEHLTETGLIARRFCFISFTVFVMTLLSMIIMSACHQRPA